jgi:hypothetical protein
MALSVNDRETVQAFRAFVEDSLSADDRYGTASRIDRPDGSVTATRFNVGGPCWLELAVRPSVPEIRLAFVTDDAVTNDGILELVSDAGQSLSEFVQAGLQEAGLEEPTADVEHSQDGKNYRFSTGIKLDEVSDLEMDEVRDKTLQYLEGFMIAFGPALLVETDPGEPDDWEEDE